MITRNLTETLISRLSQFPAVALLGPRQVGKTTLAQMLSKDISAVYLDLENPKDLRKLTDPQLYLASVDEKLVILDEVHRVPNLFNILRGIIDKGRESGQKAGRFLLLGSASLDLLRQSGESLAGRIAYVELGPLNVLEVHATEAEKLWVRGGFPDSFLSINDSASSIWRQNFIRTYLERDIPQLGPRIPAETLRRFWTMLAHNQGALLNSAQLARSLGVDNKTITRYLDLLVDLLLVHRLSPFYVNVKKRLVKSPKTYVRDSGLVHSLLGLRTLDDIYAHPISGASWEGFVLENLYQVASPDVLFSFYRTAAGAEIDILMEFPGGRLWAVEVKRSLSPKLQRGFYHSLKDLNPECSFVVHPGSERYPISKGVEVISLKDLCALLAEESL